MPDTQSRRGAALATLVALLVPPGLAAQDPIGPEVALPSQEAYVAGGAGPTIAIEVIYTDLAGHPTADVPGLPGVHFSAFDRPFGNARGDWGLTADTDAPAATDEIALFNGEVVAVEGNPIGASAELYGLLDTRLAVDPSGAGLFLATNTDAVTTADDVIVGVGPGGTATVFVREGDPVPGLPGASWGATLDSVALARDSGNALLLSFHANGVAGPPADQNELLFLNNVVAARSALDVPTGQTGAPQPWENFALERLWVDEAGSRWLAQGDLAGDVNFDGVVVVDGAVVVQEGVVLPGTAFPEPVDASGIVNVSMSPDGDWFVRGNNDATEQDWVYSNGTLVATDGDPVTPGAAETWTDAEFADLFFLHVADRRGNVVIGGVSNAPTVANGLLVVAGEKGLVVARENDPFDLDGDGTPDDGFRFNTFGNDDGVLTDEGWFYFVATIRDAGGAAIGDGYFRADLRCHLMPFTDGFESNDTDSWCLTVL